MKTSFVKLAGGLALVALSSAAMASVVNTKHNLGSSNMVSSNHTTGTTEICIFCHTPHGGDATTFAPLWNRAQSSAPNYQRFSTLNRLTFDAKEAPIVGSVSAACLSCHDGTQAMDAVINTPGSDTQAATDPGNTLTQGITANLGGNWSQGRQMGGAFTPADGSWDGVGVPRGDMVYLGTDLRNDHPISMQYGGGGLTELTPSAQTNDPDFAQVAPGGSGPGKPGGLVATPNGGTSHAGNNNTTGGVAGSGTGYVNYDTTVNGIRWWVDTGGTGYQSTDFPLYTRTDVTNSGGVKEPTVECGTCHDPHSGNSTFLRLTTGNLGSGVCLTCHAK